MKAFTNVVFLIGFLMTVYIQAQETLVKVDKKVFIDRLLKKHAKQIKGLVPIFDGSELMKQIPNSDFAVVMFPCATSANENDSVFSLLLAVVDLKYKSIVQSYFHKDIAQSDAIYVSDISLDTKKFHDISKHTTFAVTIQYTGSSRPNPYGSSTLYMYGLKDGKMSLILDGLEVMSSGGENDTAGTGFEISTTLTYKSHKTSKEYDTLIFDSLSKRVDFDYSDNKSEENISGVVRKETQLQYIDGKYENIDLKHLEAEVKVEEVQKKAWEKLLLGSWRDEKDDFTIEIDRKDRRLHYTIQTPKRKLTGELKITIEDAVYIDFSNVRWAEWRGNLTEEEYVNVGKPQKKEELPVGVEALFDWENEEFVIQNDGNAMNYYVKFRESNSKFMEFRRSK